MQLEDSLVLETKRCERTCVDGVSAISHVRTSESVGDSVEETNADTLEYVGAVCCDNAWFSPAPLYASIIQHDSLGAICLSVSRCCFDDFGCWRGTGCRIILCSVGWMMQRSRTVYHSCMQKLLAVEPGGVPITVPLGSEHFDLLRIIGQGAFGKVIQVGQREKNGSSLSSMCAHCTNVRLHILYISFLGVTTGSQSAGFQDLCHEGHQQEVAEKEKSCSVHESGARYLDQGVYPFKRSLFVPLR